MKYQQANMFKIALICFAILLLGLISASITHAQTENYSFVTKWGSFGTGDRQFEYPTGIAVDSSGNVYVADSSRIQKFDSSGYFITKWGSVGTGDGQFIGTDGIAVDSSGNVYALDRLNGRIEKFDSSGNFITKWDPTGNGFKYIIRLSAIAVDSSGNVYFLNDKTDRIEKFDSRGKLITEWGSSGTGDEQYSSYVSGIAVDSSGNVYIADNGKSRIEKFDSRGKFITKWGSLGIGGLGIVDGQFHQISGITVDSLGNVYVSDYMEHRIQKFDNSGIFITKWGSFGRGDGNISGPSGVTVDSSGNVYVSDMVNNRISKFAPKIPSNIFYPGIGWSVGDIGYAKTAKNLNAKMVNSYMNTGVPDGALQVYLACIGIGTEKNFLSNNTDTGSYNIAFAHSGGTRTLVSKIESGKVKANDVVLAAPALITQEELQGLITNYGVKKVVVIQSEWDMLNLLNVTLERNYKFSNGQTSPALTIWLDNLPLSQIPYIPDTVINLAIDNPGTGNSILNSIFHLPFGEFGDVINQYLHLSPIIPTFELSKNNNQHFLTVDLTSFLIQSGQSSSIIPISDNFWIGGSDRTKAKLFTDWSKNHNSNNDIIVVSIPHVDITENPVSMHSRLGVIMGDYYSNDVYPFDGSIEGLENPRFSEMKGSNE